MSRSTLRGCKDGGQFVRLLKQRLGFRHGKNSRFSHQFRPQNCFVRFLNHYSNLSHKFGFRAGPANSSIICRDRSAGSQKLLTYHLSIRLIRQRSVEPDHSQSECFRPISQLLRLTVHRDRLQIAQSPNGPITRFLTGRFLRAQYQSTQWPPLHQPATALRTFSAVSADSRSRRCACAHGMAWQFRR
jgi:hypothetical protein